MKPGKLPPDVLERLLRNRGAARPDVLVGPAIGEDSAIVDAGSEVIVLSTDPITGASVSSGWLAVHVACNDVAANGAEPVGVLVTLLLAVHEGTEAAERLMAEANEAALELGIAILGGHTEVTAGIDRSIISVTAIGKAPRRRYLTSAGARRGHVLLMTKAAGIEGTAILASDFRDELRGALAESVIARAVGLRRLISVVAEGVFAARAGASALHDVTEGGVVGAAFELARASQVGIELDADSIPILPETRVVCGHFGLDPLCLIGSGALLITAPAELEMDKSLARAGIPATVIGWASDGPSAIRRNGLVAPLLPPETDELFRFLASRRPAPG